MIRLLALTWWRLCYRQDDAAEQEIVRNPSGQEMLSDRDNTASAEKNESAAMPT